MGMQIGNSKNKGPISDINVTPLVDVMLVLLVIFMVTAPLMLNGINLQLPKTNNAKPLNITAQQVVLSLTKSEELYLGKNKILLSELTQAVLEDFKRTQSDTLFFRADHGVAYGRVAYLMAFLNKNGITKIALVTEAENAK
jgi:biopolymer transport protein TolR